MKNPTKTFRSGPISASVWLNPRIIDNEVKNSPSVKFTKAYKKNPQEKEYSYTNSFNVGDLPDVILVAQEVYRHMRLQYSTNEKTADQAGP